MRKIAAIARLTLMEAARSRLAAFLAAFLLLIAIGFPLVIKGDGTPVGQIRVALNYTLGAMALLTGIATLWISCGAISRDIEHGQLRLTIVKPVHRHQVWIGRWLGILATNAALLAMCGIVICAIARWKTSRGSITGEDRRILSEQILVGRRRITPRRPDINEESAHRLENLRVHMQIPANIPDEAALDVIRKHMISERTVLPPGKEMEWTIEVNARVPEEAVPSLRFRFKSPMRSAGPLRGVWSIRSSGQPDTFTLPQQEFSDDIHVLPLPGELFSRDGTQIQVRFMNCDAQTSHTALFPQRDAVEILLRESGFEMNLLRSLIVILCHLALLSALGLTAGSFLSFPVASFAAVSAIVAVLVSHFFVFASAPEHATAHHHHHEHPPPEISLLEKTGSAIIEKIRVVAEPAVRMDVPGLVSDGILVSWQRVGKTMLILIGVYSGTLGVLGSCILARRELALSR